METIMTTTMPTPTRARLRDFARRHTLPPQAEQDLMAIFQNHVDGMEKRRRALVAHWAEQARLDPEFGRNALPAALHTARQAVDRFGGDRLKQALDETGAGSHPEIIRAFWKVGKATADQRSAGPKRRPTHEETMRAMCPSMYGNKI